MRFLAIALIVAVVVVLAIGPLLLGRRQVARQTGRPLETRGLVPVAIVVGLLAAALAALSLGIRPGIIVLTAAGVAITIAAVIVLGARSTSGCGLPKVPTLVLLVAGGVMAAVGLAALVELLANDRG